MVQADHTPLLKTTTCTRQPESRYAWEVLLLWQVRPGPLNVVVASSGDNEIVLRCELDRVQTLTNFYQLRQEPLFANASLAARKLWRETVTKKNRPVYKWYLTKVEVPSQKVLAPPGRGTWSFVPAACMPQGESEVDIPEMNLASTGLYFIRRLATEDTSWNYLLGH